MGPEVNTENDLLSPARLKTKLDCGGGRLTGVSGVWLRWLLRSAAVAREGGHFRWVSGCSLLDGLSNIMSVLYQGGRNSLMFMAKSGRPCHWVEALKLPLRCSVKAMQLLGGSNRLYECDPRSAQTSLIFTQRIWDEGKIWEGRHSAAFLTHKLCIT